MPNIDKVMKGLELCTDSSGRLCVSCPYYLDDDCPEQLCADALALLKEQETVIPKVSSTEQRCGNCNKVIEMDGWIACPWCGKPIAWDKWWNKNGEQEVK